MVKENVLPNSEAFCYYCWSASR